MDLYETMFTALVQDRVDFVQLFMDNGVDLKRFLTVQRLRDLYDDVSAIIMLYIIIALLIMAKG